jgi:hypothetical protein
MVKMNARGWFRCSAREVRAGEHSRSRAESCEASSRGSTLMRHHFLVEHNAFGLQQLQHRLIHLATHRTQHTARRQSACIAQQSKAKQTVNQQPPPLSRSKKQLKCSTVKHELSGDAGRNADRTSHCTPTAAATGYVQQQSAERRKAEGETTAIKRQSRGVGCHLPLGRACLPLHHKR